MSEMDTLQITLTEQQKTALRNIAERTGTSEDRVLARAIDRGLKEGAPDAEDFDDAYYRALQDEVLTEWSSAEDDRAFADL